MPESFNQNFMDVMSSGDIEPRVVISVFASTGEELRCVSGPNRVYASYSDDRLAWYPSILLSLTPRSSKWNVEKDSFEVGNISFAVQDNQYFRDFMAATQIKNARVEVQTGTDDLAYTDWERIWTGYVSGYRSDGERITITAKDPGYTFQDSSIAGEWTAIHPLDALLELLVSAGVPPSNINIPSFDSSSSGIHGSSRIPFEHMVVSRHGQKSDSDQGLANEVGSPGKPENAKSVIDDLSRLCFGFIAIDRSGELRFNPFDREATLDRLIAREDIIKLEHVSSCAFRANRVEFSYDAIRRTGEREWTQSLPSPVRSRLASDEFQDHSSEKIVYALNDLQAQTDFQPVASGSSPDVVTFEIHTKWIKAMGLVSTTACDPRRADGTLPPATPNPLQRPQFYDPTSPPATSEVAPLIVGPALHNSWSPFRTGFSGTNLSSRPPMNYARPTPSTDLNLYWDQGSNPACTSGEAAIVAANQVGYGGPQSHRVWGFEGRFAYFLVIDSSYDGSMEIINGVPSTPNSYLSVVRARSSWWSYGLGCPDFTEHIQGAGASIPFPWIPGLFRFTDPTANHYYEPSPTPPNTNWGEVPSVPCLQRWPLAGRQEFDEYGYFWPTSIHYEIDRFDLYNSGRYGHAGSSSSPPLVGGIYFWDHVYDVTIPHVYSERRLSWLSYGVPHIKIKLNLRHCDLRPGDIVACEDDVYIGFGSPASGTMPGDGLTSVDNFIVIGVEDDYLGDPPGILVEMVWIASGEIDPVVVDIQPAIQAVHSSHIRTSSPDGSGRSRGGMRLFSEPGFDFEITGTTGLDVTIGQGALTDGTGIGSVSPGRTITLPADSEVLICGSPDSKSLSISNYPLGAIDLDGAQPAFLECLLWHLTTGPSSVSSQVDHRNLSPVPGISKGPEYQSERTFSPVGLASSGQDAMMTDTDGGSYGIRPGQGVGTGAGGDFFVDLARSGASGSTLNPYIRALQIAAETGIESLISHTADTDGHIHRATGTAQSVGASSEVVLSIDTFTANQGGYIRVDLSGTDAGGGGGSYRVSTWVLKASFTTDGAEAVTVHTSAGSQVLHSELGGSPYWIVLVAASGTSLEVQVTGAAGTTANWMATAEWQARAIP